jgi:general secretion pathway protein I
VKNEKSSGFTLLEVMVAIAILALSLTAIFSSEAGAVKMAHRSRKMGLASLLVRCKMGEIEEQMASEGLPAVFDSGSDQCCEDGEIDGFSCDWEIEPVTLPDNMFASEEDEEGDGKDGKGGGKANPMDKIGAALGLPTGKDGEKPSLDNVDPSQLLSGGGAGGLASMALSMVFPVLKPSFEQQIRRATVTVHWKEGSLDHSFDVTQYLVSDQPIVDPAAAAAAAAAANGGATPPGNVPPSTGPGSFSPIAPGGPILGGATQ